MTERGQGRHPQGLVSLSRRSTKGYTRLGLDVPVRLNAVLEESVGQLFACELTDEGILFRPVPLVMLKTETPSWTKGER